jgi:hypothetical protein
MSDFRQYTDEQLQLLKGRIELEIFKRNLKHCFAESLVKADSLDGGFIVLNEEERNRVYEGLSD